MQKLASISDMNITSACQVKTFEEVELGSVFQAKVRRHTRWCIRALAPNDSENAVAVILSPVDEAEDPGGVWPEPPDETDLVLDYGMDWICQPSLKAAHVAVGEARDLSVTGSLLLSPKATRVAITNWSGKVPLLLDFDGYVIAKAGYMSRAIIVKQWDILLRRENGLDPIKLVTVIAKDPRAMASNSGQ